MPVGEFIVAKELVPKYLALNDRATALLKKYNPCAVSEGTCARGRSGGTNFCCSGCKNLGVNGCTVHKLQCALWMCDYTLIPEPARTNFKKEMWDIFLEAEQLNLLVPRGSMADSISHACDVAMMNKHAQKKAKEKTRYEHVYMSKEVGKVPDPVPAPVEQSTVCSKECDSAKACPPNLQCSALASPTPEKVKVTIAAKEKQPFFTRWMP